MNTSNQTLSRNDIAAAVQRGEQLRQERIEQAARAREEAIRLLVNAAPQRADEILDRIHHLIVETVADAEDTPRSFVVMWVEDYEYEGETERNLGLGFHGPHQGQPENLKHAARQVYDALAHLSPALVYKSKEALSGKGQLAITIRLD
jgi:hypothetical protein